MVGWTRCGDSCGGRWPSTCSSTRRAARSTGPGCRRSWPTTATGSARAPSTRSAVLALSALYNNDKAGLFVFTEDVEEYIPPKKGRRHVLHIIREVLAYQPRRHGTRIGRSLQTMVQVLKRRCILFLISDFRDTDFEGPLRLAALKHDVIPVVVSDPREAALPALSAFLDLEDPESGRRILVDAGAPALLERHRRQESERLRRLEDFFRRCGLDFIHISTDRPYLDPIIRFFRQRARRLRR